MEKEQLYARDTLRNLISPDSVIIAYSRQKIHASYGLDFYAIDPISHKGKAKMPSIWLSSLLGKAFDYIEFNETWEYIITPYRLPSAYTARIVDDLSDLVLGRMNNNLPFCILD